MCSHLSSTWGTAENRTKPGSGEAVNTIGKFGDVRRNTGKMGRLGESRVTHLDGGWGGPH